jgi:N-acetylated-alpha-linked acidic dipeptidase
VRWLLVIALAACGGEKKPAAKKDDAGVAAARVSGEADRDKLFLSVPSANAVEGIVERLSAQPHLAGTPANEAVAKEIMRTLGRMGWKVGTQQYDVYLPHPKTVTLDGVPLEDWLAYSGSGKVKAPVVEILEAKGKIALVPFGLIDHAVMVRDAERAGTLAVILWDTEARRDSLLRDWQRPGDPLTPGAGAMPGTPRLRPRDVDVLPKIPVITVSEATAVRLRGKTAEIVVEMDGETRPVRNIIAILEGKSKEAVIIGNHYDAWGPGAVDPHTGTAALIEIARGLTALTRAGWRPQRTIVLAFWDGKEPGMLGSTEWVEANLAQLQHDVVAYLNLDWVLPGELAVRGDPMLAGHVRACAAPHADPFEARAIHTRSDAAPFQFHAGIASLDFRTRSDADATLHSKLDDLAQAKRTDPGFTFTPRFAGMVGLCAIQLADAEMLPFDYVAVADAIDAAIGDKRDARITASLARLREAGTRAKGLATKGGGDPAKCNAAMIAARRGLLDPDGVVGRPWFKDLAGGDELVAADNDRALRSAQARLAAAIDRATAALEPCR